MHCLICLNRHWAARKSNNRPISSAGSGSYLSDWGKASLCLSPPCWEVQDWTDWNWCRGSYRDCLLVVANVSVKSAAEPQAIVFGSNYLIFSYLQRTSVLQSRRCCCWKWWSLANCCGSLPPRQILREASGYLVLMDVVPF